LEIEILAARNGESRLISYGERDRRFRILVDCGPPNTARQLLTSLNALPPDQRTLELLVLTHVDSNCIGAALSLLQNRELAMNYRDIWFNGFRHLDGAEVL
jgi:Cft2 family RNA processing exonuclease